jgi:hypothetical protein
VTIAVDAAVFDALVADLGAAQSGLRQELLEAYLFQSGPHIEELVAAAQRSDLRTVQRLAHLMRSSSALLGAFGLADLLGVAEEAARSGFGNDLRQVSAAILREYVRVESDMTKLLLVTQRSSV